jgi:glycosyltransferase AglI
MQPIISIIIPVYNDPEGLKDTLDSLINQDFGKSLYEIIIADNNSKDNTISVAKEYENNFPDLIKVTVEDKIQSSYAARNKGIVFSKSEILVFIDADMIVHKDFLKKINNVMMAGKIDVAGCNILMMSKNKSIAGIYDQITGFNIEETIRNKHFVSTNCMIIKKDVFDKAGFFNSKLISGGDREFGYRVWKMGYKMHFLKYISIIHPAKAGIKQLYKRYFRLGQGIADLKFYYPYVPFFENKEFSLTYLLPLRPDIFIKKMLKKRKIFKFPVLYICFFYFIKWFLKIGKFRGYIYKKRLLKTNNSINKSRNQL